MCKQEREERERRERRERGERDPFPSPSLSLSLSGLAQKSALGLEDKKWNDGGWRIREIKEKEERGRGHISIHNLS